MSHCYHHFRERHIAIASQEPGLHPCKDPMDFNGVGFSLRQLYQILKA